MDKLTIKEVDEKTSEKLHSLLYGIIDKLSTIDYKYYFINKNRIVFNIENNEIVSILLKNEDNGKEHIVIEEIFNAHLGKSTLKSLSGKIKDYWVSYFEFNGILGQDEIFKGKSQYETINKALPQLKIDERYKEWYGIDENYIGFELEDNGIKGYAIVPCNHFKDTRFIKTIGKHLTSPFYMFEKQGYYSGSINNNYETYKFYIDENMYNIICKRYSQKEDSLKFDRNNLDILDLKGFQFTINIKDNAKPEDILKKLQGNKFSNIEIFNIYNEDEIKEIQEKKNLIYHYVLVEFADFDDIDDLYYISDDSSVKEGEFVIVNVKSKDYVALVSSAKDYEYYNAPFSPKRTKKVIEKISKDDLEKYGYSLSDFQGYEDYLENNDDDEDDYYEFKTENFTYKEYCIITTLCNKEEIANEIVSQLLKEKLVAGAQISKVKSKYWWKDRLEEDDEFKLEFRTKSKNIESVKNVIKSIHDYEVAEISVTYILAPDLEFKKWIDENVVIMIPSKAKNSEE